MPTLEEIEQLKNLKEKALRALKAESDYIPVSVTDYMDHVETMLYNALEKIKNIKDLVDVQ